MLSAEVFLLEYQIRDWMSSNNYLIRLSDIDNNNYSSSNAVKIENTSNDKIMTYHRINDNELKIYV